MHCAAEGGHMEILKYFADENVSVHLKDYFGVSILCYITERRLLLLF